VHVGMY